MRIFEASCNNGVVTADGGIITSCPILGEGGNSNGYLIIVEGDLVYIPKTSPDLSTTLQLLSTILSTIASGVLKANAGGDITSPTFSADLAEIKKQVDELKGALR